MNQQLYQPVCLIHYFSHMQHSCQTILRIVTQQAQLSSQQLQSCNFIFVMNYFKKTWNAMFSKQQTQNTNQPATEEDIDIPPDILEELFNLSAEFMGKSDKNHSNQTKLALYGLYKQATVGDCDKSKPGMFDMVGKAKWDSWNNLKGMNKESAMKNYIGRANEADQTISHRIEQYFNGESEKVEEDSKTNKKSSGMNPGVGLKKVEAIDYSDEYSHPYFKAIQKGLQISQIEYDQLLIKNDSPAVYPLHFAIDKQRLQLVQKFLQILSIEQIESMVDEEGTGILQYAELIENDEIVEMVKQKLEKSK